MPVERPWSGLKDAETFFNTHALFQGWLEPGLANLFLFQSVCREHFAERQFHNHEAPGRTSILLAVSRMQYLLGHGREALAGKFSLRDIARLLDVLVGDMLAPQDLEYPAAPVIDTFGWNNRADIPNDWLPLVDTLESLSPLERVALADVLERLWHVETRKQGRFDEGLLLSMGVTLKPTMESA